LNILQINHAVDTPRVIPPHNNKANPKKSAAAVVQPTIANYERARIRETSDVPVADGVVVVILTEEDFDDEGHGVVNAVACGLLAKISRLNNSASRTIMLDYRSYPMLYNWLVVFKMKHSLTGCALLLS